MPVRTSITTDAEGRRVLAKVAGTADEAIRLEREAAQLEAARHPGVVELVGTDGHGVGAILLTAAVDGPSLAEVGRLPVEEGSGLLAALASTLADLHALGLVHGAVCPEHVLVGPGGRPVLCGFGYGGRAGEPACEAAAELEGFTDPARGDGDLLTHTFDVFALGALARFLAPDAPPGHVLANVAEQAMADDALARPTAAALAEALQDAVPEARLPRALVSQPTTRPSSAPGDPLAVWRRDRDGLAGPRRLTPSRGLTMVAAVAALAVIGAAVVLAGSRGGPAPAPLTELAEPAPDAPDLPDPRPPADVQPDEVQPGPTTTRAGLVPSLTTTPLARRHDCTPLTAVLQADVDGDGCPDALRYAEGVLEAGDVRWSLGRAGDQVAAGDWTCQGSRTLALFRPATGEIFRFDGWAGPGHDVGGVAVARVHGGEALRAADVDRDGCHEAVVERATGVAEVVRLAGPQP